MGFRRLGCRQCQIERFRPLAHRSARLPIRMDGSQQILQFSEMDVFVTADGLRPDWRFGREME